MGAGARWITDTMLPSVGSIFRRIKGWFKGEKKKRPLRLVIEDGKWRFTRERRKR